MKLVLFALACAALSPQLHADDWTGHWVMQAPTLARRGHVSGPGEITVVIRFWQILALHGIEPQFSKVDWRPGAAHDNAKLSSTAVQSGFM